MSEIAIVFAAGRGGSPSRHAQLIERMEAAGFAVAAPDAPMLAGTMPTAEELAGRAEALAVAIARIPEEARIVGVGHSIGASVLAAMAGATMWLSPGRQAPIARAERLDRLVMLAPPTGFFMAPGALDGLRLPILLRSGGADPITPPASHAAFVAALPDPSLADHATEPQAGHFSFMDSLPPGQQPAFAGEAGFRARLHEEIAAFAAG